MKGQYFITACREQTLLLESLFDIIERERDSIRTKLEIERDPTEMHLKQGELRALKNFRKTLEGEVRLRNGTNDQRRIRPNEREVY